MLVAAIRPLTYIHTYQADIHHFHQDGTEGKSQSSKVPTSLASHRHPYGVTKSGPGTAILKIGFDRRESESLKKGFLTREAEKVSIRSFVRPGRSFQSAVAAPSSLPTNTPTHVAEGSSAD